MTQRHEMLDRYDTLTAAIDAAIFASKFILGCVR
jgi:hypothetical protein